MKKFKIAFLLITFALQQSCQQNEPIQKPNLNTAELENLLKTNSDYKGLVTELNVSTTAFLEDLKSNFSQLPKEELENMNRIWIKYGSGKDFTQLATESEKSVFEKMALKSKSSSTAFNNRISKLSKEVSLKYSFENGSMYSVLIILHEDLMNKNLGGRTTLDNYCMHRALARYYEIMADGANEHTAFIFMQGYYSGCVRN